MFLSPSNLTEFLNPIIKSCTLFENKIVNLYVIANPCAGGFTRKRVSKANYEKLEAISESAKNREQITTINESVCHETSHPGEGGRPEEGRRGQGRGQGQAADRRAGEDPL